MGGATGARCAGWARLQLVDEHVAEAAAVVLQHVRARVEEAEHAEGQIGVVQHPTLEQPPLVLRVERARIATDDVPGGDVDVGRSEAMLLPFLDLLEEAPGRGRRAPRPLYHAHLPHDLLQRLHLLRLIEDRKILRQQPAGDAGRAVSEAPPKCRAKEEG